MGIAKDIRRELDARGWSVYELAKQSGVLEHTLDSILNKDRSPRVDTVQKIAHGFGITIDQLIENPKPVRRYKTTPASIRELRIVLSSMGIDAPYIDIIVAAAKAALDNSWKWK